MKQWIKKVLKGTPDRQGGPSKKAKQEIEAKLETLFFIMEISIFIRSKPLLRQCRQSLHF